MDGGRVGDWKTLGNRLRGTRSRGNTLADDWRGHLAEMGTGGKTELTVGYILSLAALRAETTAKFLAADRAESSIRSARPHCAANGRHADVAFYY